MPYFREQKQELIDALASGKIVVLTGPRQVGKTTLINSLFDKQVWEFNFDLEEDRSFFDKTSKLKIDTLVSSLKSQNKKVIFIDEIQKNLKAFELVKYIYDHYKDIKIIVSGSTALEI